MKMQLDFAKKTMRLTQDVKMSEFIQNIELYIPDWTAWTLLKAEPIPISNSSISIQPHWWGGLGNHEIYGPPPNGYPEIYNQPHSPQNITEINVNALHTYKDVENINDLMKLAEDTGMITYNAAANQPETPSLQYNSIVNVSFAGESKD